LPANRAGRNPGFEFQILYFRLDPKSKFIAGSGELQELIFFDLGVQSGAQRPNRVQISLLTNLTFTPQAITLAGGLIWGQFANISKESMGPVPHCLCPTRLWKIRGGGGPQGRAYGSSIGACHRSGAVTRPDRVNVNNRSRLRVPGAMSQVHTKRGFLTSQPGKGHGHVNPPATRLNGFRVKIGTNKRLIRDAASGF
jgi:hypothetical protein